MVIWSCMPLISSTRPADRPGSRGGRRFTVNRGRSYDGGACRCNSAASPSSVPSAPHLQACESDSPLYKDEAFYRKRRPWV